MISACECRGVKIYKKSPSVKRQEILTYFSCQNYIYCFSLEVDGKTPSILTRNYCYINE